MFLFFIKANANRSVTIYVFLILEFHEKLCPGFSWSQPSDTETYGPHLMMSAVSGPRPLFLHPRDMPAIDVSYFHALEWERYLETQGIACLVLLFIASFIISLISFPLFHFWIFLTRNKIISLPKIQKSYKVLRNPKSCIINPIFSKDLEVKKEK
jgi:hypothetical protein